MRYERREMLFKWLVLACAVSAVGLYFAAWFQPMWGWYLSAPQYPFGLVLSVYMDHVSGDVTEINILNHYIGMAKLEEAARFERAIAGYGLSAIGLATLLMVFLPGRRFSRWFALPAFNFPIVFVLAMYRWMYLFGHKLSPDAPVTVAPFTPTLVGAGKIGNFSTIGLPGPGFYMILGAGFLTILMYFLRLRVCRGCPYRATCGAICSNHLLNRKRKRSG